MSTSGAGGTIAVPISFGVNNLGQVNYNNATCTKYEIQIWSSDGAAHNGVSLAAPSGTTADPASVDVPATGYAYSACYVPLTRMGPVTVTASSSGYTNKSIPVTS